MRPADLLMVASTSLLGCGQSPAPSRMTLGANSAVLARPSAAEPRSVCPSGMLLADGKYCPSPVQRCLEWLDVGRYHHYRCARYEEPASCSGPLRPLLFCVDRDEYVAPGESLPLTALPLREAESLCNAAGKRLCLESEWNFACEGEQMNPYPYGFIRDSGACNADKAPLVALDGTLVSLAQRPGSFPRCDSAFSVRDMTGNVEEWVLSDRLAGRGVMKGAYWTPTKNNCRSAQRVHSPLYRGIELGFRCCADVTKR